MSNQNIVHVFEILSVDDKYHANIKGSYKEKFYEFFQIYNLLPLFTNEHRTSIITVTDNDLRAVVNTGGAYHKLLKDFSDYLNLATDNKSYEEALFRIIHNAKTFQQLMNNIKRIKQAIEGEIGVGYLYNMWNIVWYEKKK